MLTKLVMPVLLLLLAGAVSAQGGSFDVTPDGGATVSVTLAQVSNVNIVLYNGVQQPGATWEMDDGDGDGDEDDFVITDGAGIAILQDGATIAKGDAGDVLDGAADGKPDVGEYTRTN